MKLQKLIYIANGIHLASHGKPLIVEPIETWDYGPVIQSVYRNYKIFGSNSKGQNLSVIPNGVMESYFKKFNYPRIVS